MAINDKLRVGVLACAIGFGATSCVDNAGQNVKEDYNWAYSDSQRFGPPTTGELMQMTAKDGWEESERDFEEAFERFPKKQPDYCTEYTDNHKVGPKFGTQLIIQLQKSGGMGNYPAEEARSSLMYRVSPPTDGKPGCSYETRLGLHQHVAEKLLESVSDTRENMCGFVERAGLGDYDECLKRGDMYIRYE